MASVQKLKRRELWWRMTETTTIRNAWNLVLIAGIGVFPLIVAAAPIASGVIRAAWVVFWIGIFTLVAIRVARFSVIANESGLTVRNLGRDCAIPWTDVASIEAGRSDNVTGAVTTIVVQRVDGTKLVARAASAYSRRKVEEWRDQLESMRGRSA